MEQFELSYCTVIHHDNGVLESIVNEGVEISEKHVDELFLLIQSIKPKVRGFLANRKNRYSFSFKANLKLATSNLVEYTAVVTRSKFPWPLKDGYFPVLYKLSFFDDYNKAMLWLESKIN